MTDEAFAEGMARICIVFGREQTDALLAAYLDELGPVFETDPEWRAEVKHVLQTERFWPTPAVFLARRQAQKQLAFDLDASSAFDAAWRAKSHNGQIGSFWLRSVVVNKCGERVALAFEAVGGAGSFKAALNDETRYAFLRKDFVAAYGTRKASDDPRTALTPAEPVAALSDGSAVDLVKRLRDDAQEGAA